MQARHWSPSYPRPHPKAPVVGEGLTAPYPGQRSVGAGGGQGTRSVGGERMEGIQYPGKGSSSDPPGHRAPEGQGVQSSPAPQGHVALMNKLLILPLLLLMPLARAAHTSGGA